MPLIPWSALIRATGRLAATEVAAGLVNPILDGYCSVLPQVNEFFRDAQNALVPGLGDTLSIPRRALDSLVCPGTPLPEAQPLPGTWGQGCDSFGRVAGYIQRPGQDPQFSSREWQCGANSGLPVAAPEWINLANPGGQAWSWAILLERADGTRYHQLITVGSEEAAKDFSFITDINIQPCPGCQSTPLTPNRPGFPPRLPPGVLPPPPQFPVTIELPRLPGLPPITIPLVYAPINIRPSLNFPVTLAPVLNLNPTLALNPAFNFAPKIELNLGGISITGGGYPEPVADVEELCPGGGECPDPCPELDYDRIREINFEELDSKFPPKRPTTLVESLQPVGESGTFVLPAFTQWIELRIVTVPPNVRMQTGGTLAPEVRYNGWYSFGATGESSERIPFHYDFISILVPPKTSAFSYTVYSGGTAQATIGYLLPAP